MTHVCYINNTSPAGHTRYLQSIPGVDLGPGESVSVVLALLFAAPVSDPSCTQPCDIIPGDVTIHGDPVRMAAGVPDVDKLAGYLGFADADGDGRVSRYEYQTVPRSLYGKAQLAQAIFDGGFLTPTAPGAPDFFLVPGDSQVTVMWRPSSSEQSGDPYYQVAKDATRPQPGGGPAGPNPLYDPNYREFDVEGYRVYRGRTDAPDEVTLVAQFDYGGTVIEDYGGQVNPDRQCAPELGLIDSCPAYIPAEFQPGVTRTVSVPIELSQYFFFTGGSTLDQVRFGDRRLLPNATAVILLADTAGTGDCDLPLCPFALQNNGVPFVYVDDQVRNGFNYYYTVVAFDFNSWQSGPSSLESARILKPVTPSRAATNYQNAAAITTGIYGRDSLLDHEAQPPTIDAVTGRFSGPFPPSDAWIISAPALPAQLLRGKGSFVVRLDSLQLGSPYEAVPHRYWFTASSGEAPLTIMLPITQPSEIGLRRGDASLPGIAVDDSLSARYGGSGTYRVPGAFAITMEGPDYHSLYGRGCVNGRDGFGHSRECAYNGSRWFDGPSPTTNEAMDHPIGANVANFSGNAMADFTNAGQLVGVSLLHNTQAYQSVGGGEFRPMEGIKSGARRAADFNVYWGTAGRIDSVIDVTHNVPVPFAADHLGGTWGILNPSAAQPFAGSYDNRPELTSTDFHCLPPANQFNVGAASCAGGPVYSLSRTVIPGPVVPFSTGLAAAQTAAPWSDPGFGLYISGDIFTIGLTGGQLPTGPARVWSLRTYIGAISGGSGAGGDYGPYTFNVFPAGTVVPRSWTAVGTEVRLQYDAVNTVLAATADDLADVHPVPDPFYFAGGYDDPQTIRFINLPERAIIRIYTSSGILVTLLEHDSSTFGGEAEWDATNRSGDFVAPGVYFYHVESGDARRLGKMLVVNANR